MLLGAPTEDRCRYTSDISSESDSTEWEPDTGEGRVRAASYLTILNPEVPPEELSQIVGLEPDELWRKGEPRRNRYKTHPFNGVSYRSSLDDRRTPRAHFQSLIERLRPHADQIAAVADLPSTQSARIWIVEHTNRDNIDTIIEPDDVAIVSAMHVQVAFSAYYYDE